MKTEYQTVKVELDKGLAVVRMDNPPVNQMSDYFLEELFQAVREALAAGEVSAIILTGTGKSFIAGADLTQVVKLKDRSEILPKLMAIHEFLREVESAPKPVIAAINGNCLGGGLEVAMSCHYRIAAPGMSLGLPEVKLGLLPGSGGTQRLPRLIGLPEALTLMTTGRFIKTEKAFSLGLVDEVAEPEALVEAGKRAAAKFASRMLNLSARVASQGFSRLPSAAEKADLMEMARATARATAKNYLAPFKIIEAVSRGLSTDFWQDIEREAQLFCDCLLSGIAQNLIGIFLNERATGRLPRIQGMEPKRPKKVAMLGGGVMGSGIVHLLLGAGLETVLWDINDQALAHGLKLLHKTYAYQLKKGKLRQDQLDQLLAAKLTTTSKLEDLGEVDLIIEAVLEDMEVKQDIWKKLENICRPEVVFGTNTSALPISEMAGVLDDPGRMIGLHFFNPAERMPLLEIICGQKTSDQTLATAVAFGRQIKKVPVVVNDGPGFYVSRQLMGLMGGAISLLADGVDLAQMEKALTDFGLPMGPFTLFDLTGIDINYHVEKTFERELGPRYQVHPLSEAVYQLGDYGRKTGAGFLDYSHKEPVPNPRVVEMVERYRQDNGVQPRQAEEREIVDLMLAMAINEAALMMEQGICDRPADMDLAMIYGAGFPPYRGGVLRYADSWGLAMVHDKLKELEAKYGPRFAPAELLGTMAQEGKTFYQS
ncbi:MAG: enoyl-CoA hydratase/isomerase family protein [Desulfarculaceae bacterium]|nr:enoyl-CoA hydratase/isomerase family protein [Desulfarculaceae bacterium]MCF8071194.1 enoyl-CoA hydratase/isomerase family protein [Desulfarculaceae bacterium]MCF8101203.1 enoyl-CoA hydratase/isomerase family protein [Desulfarculaceae bacterium]MCF8115248.1 enoyl-CoA hydratase/isomerase family protein [Desulfarculaceae bacterium]